MVKWQYRVLRFETQWGLATGGDFDADDFERQMNRLGYEGWELVSTVQTHASGGTRYLVASFKRRLEVD